MVVFERMSSHVNQKLRLNVLFQDLAYRFMASVASVSRIFSSSWLSWTPDREQL